MALMLAFFVSPGRASAHTLDTTKTSAGQPTLQMVVGFDDNSRLDYWTPAWITLSNAGPDFKGVLTATTYANARVVADSTLPWSYSSLWYCRMAPRNRSTSMYLSMKAH